MDRRLIITYAVRREGRALLEELFAGSADLVFLAGLSPREREQALAGADALLSWNLPKELGAGEFGLIGKTRLIQLLSAGADQVPFGALRRDIVIASNAGAYAEPMAEHVLAMTLALEKDLLREHRNMAEGEFNQARPNRMLRGSACAVIGFGGIGRAVARLLRAFEVRILAVNTSGRTDVPVEFIGTLKDLERVLSAADVVVISIPLVKATRGLIGKRELAWMKPDAILINVARGGVVEEQALYEHLASHPDFKAGLDAWWVEPFKDGEFRTNYPFFKLPNVLGSPHNSAVVPGMSEAALRRAAGNVERFFKGEPIAGVVRREDYGG